MINANELRIGSAVAIGVRKCTVNSIHTVPATNECFVRIEGFIEKDNQHQVYLYQLEPIPLTPEILEAYGFSNKHHEGGMEWTKESFNLLNIKDSGFELVYDSINVKYLHQLQNLYFALTGSELALKSLSPEKQK